MAVVFTAQTKDNCIPKGQQCQAFDSMMMGTDKAAQLGYGLNRLTAYCVAPAYYYIFGNSGEKFLCDFHFHLEYRSTEGVSVDHSPIQYVYSNAEEIKDTFADPPEEAMPDSKCDVVGCDKKALVFWNKLPNCNFHFRKLYYRLLSNGVMKDGPILDYRKLYINSVEEDYSPKKLRLT